jgi:hypothetical protein
LEIFSSFYTSTELGFFEAMTWAEERMPTLNPNFTQRGLSPTEIAEETTKWRNALQFFANSGRVIDMAYDGYFYHHDIDRLLTVLNYSRPDYIFIDSESFPVLNTWLSKVNLSVNANNRRRQGENDYDLGYRLCDEWIGTFVQRVKSLLPDIKIALYGASAKFNEGYQAFDWKMLGKYNIIAQPSYYGVQRVLDMVAAEQRLQRQHVNYTNGEKTVIPWLTTSWAGPYPSQYNFDLLAHLFANGATGFSIYPSTGLDDMEIFFQVLLPLLLLLVVVLS